MLWLVINKNANSKFIYIIPVILTEIDWIYICIRANTIEQIKLIYKLNT